MLQQIEKTTPKQASELGLDAMLATLIFFRQRNDTANQEAKCS